MAEQCGPENTQKAHGQTSQSKMATIWTLGLHSTSGWKSSSESFWLLAKRVHLERCEITGFDLNIKNEATCICTVLYGVNPFASPTMLFV